MNKGNYRWVHLPCCRAFFVVLDTSVNERLSSLSSLAQIAKNPTQFAGRIGKSLQKAKKQGKMNSSEPR